MKVRRVPLADLRHDPANARQHTLDNLAAIRSSLDRFGQQRPLVVRPDGTIIAGNGTFDAAAELGWTELDVVEFDGSEEEARAFAIADNRTAELAAWNTELLNAQLAELAEGGWELAELGFDFSPPTDPFAEWEGMPAYTSENRNAPFRTVIHFASEEDLEAFFSLIDRPRRTSFWWPQDDGFVGSDVKQQYVAEEG